jgi:hypothetical protein
VTLVKNNSIASAELALWLIFATLLVLVADLAPTTVARVGESAQFLNHAASLRVEKYPAFRWLREDVARAQIKMAQDAFIFMGFSVAVLAVATYIKRVAGGRANDTEER